MLAGRHHPTVRSGVLGAGLEKSGLEKSPFVEAVLDDITDGSVVNS
jgi:hypothetical protein